MNQQLIVLPLLLQVTLTVAVYLLLGRAKVEAARSGEVDEARRALHDDTWPDSVVKINNNIRNQFEVPVLFYVLCLALLVMGTVTPLAIVIAWLFVSSRVLHAYVHIYPNPCADAPQAVQLRLSHGHRPDGARRDRHGNPGLKRCFRRSPTRQVGK